MGTFMGVCAVSLLPIRGKEPVVLVAMEDPKALYWDNGFCTYSIGQQISYRFAQYAEQQAMDAAMDETAWRDCFRNGADLTPERLQELIRYTNWKRQNEIDTIIEKVKIVVGFYDEIGGVVDADGQTLWERPTIYTPHAKTWFMVKRSIWDKLTKDVKPEIGNGLETFPMEDRFLPWLKLRHLAWTCFAANIELIVWHGFNSNDLGSYLETSAELQKIIAPERKKLETWQAELMYEESDEDAEEGEFAYF
jgi:hypothetical protein